MVNAPALKTVVRSDVLREFESHSRLLNKTKLIKSKSQVLRKSIEPAILATLSNAVILRTLGKLKHNITGLARLLRKRTSSRRKPELR